MNKKVGLFFGSFNPIHVGHLIIANHMAEFSDLEEVWMVVTPHNPHKKKKTLLDDVHRFAMVRIATEDFPNLRASNIEFHLPQPSFTVNTLVALEEKHPTINFCLIMGEDNLKSFHKWKNFELILDRYFIYIYPRISKDDSEIILSNHSKIIEVAAPVVEISSTFIRKSIKSNKNVKPLLPQKVWEYVDEMNFYK
ncbi:MAG: nicotinate (nicotinamide) nucleotide adenylyltransferase [Flavobacteriaceae bacterium]|nr:nicotinate (nicotinamide) nucleotide adenylyltransferase [Flavobacteriaceae bacterium]